MRVYSAEEVHAALDWGRLVIALERAFAEGAEVPLRHAHALGGIDTLLLMPAWNSRLLITKQVTVMPGAEHTVQATVLACERVSGRPLAVLDGEAITVRRTAAASALAARRMLRSDASRMLVVGSGRLAPWMVRAHHALRPALSSIEIWGRRADAARAVAGELQGEGLPVAAVDDLEAAVRRAHLVCCVTTSQQPLVLGEWLSPGTHLDLVGGFRRDMREVDDHAVARSRILVDTFGGALAEAGDLVQPMQRGVINRDAVAGDLVSLLGGHAIGRRHDGEITLFKSVGTALEDLAAAELVLQRHHRG